MVSGALVSAGPARSGYYGAKRFQVKQQQPENRGDLDWPEFDGFQDYPSYGSQYGSTLGREGAAQAEPEPAYYDTSYPATYEQQDYHVRFFFFGKKYHNVQLHQLNFVVLGVHSFTDS